MKFMLDAPCFIFVLHTGFKKEQLRVQVTSGRNLRIFGERPLVENKWSRFRKELLTPSNYYTNKITAKFEGGILKVKHPKIIQQAHENASSAETSDLQKSERDEAAHQVPPKTKIDQETIRNNISENGASQKIPDEEKELKDSSGMNCSPENDVNNFPGKTLDNKKNETGKMPSTSCLETELKKPNKLAKLVVAGGFLVLAIGLYVKNVVTSEE